MFVDPFPTFHFARRSQRVRCSEGCPCLAPAEPPRWGAGGGFLGGGGLGQQPGVEMCWEPVHTNLAGRHPTPLGSKQSSYPASATPRPPPQMPTLVYTLATAQMGNM